MCEASRHCLRCGLAEGCALDLSGSMWGRTYAQSRGKMHLGKVHLGKVHLGKVHLKVGGLRLKVKGFKLKVKVHANPCDRLVGTAAQAQSLGNM